MQMGSTAQKTREMPTTLTGLLPEGHWPLKAGLMGTGVLLVAGAAFDDGAAGVVPVVVAVVPVVPVVPVVVTVVVVSMAVAAPTGALPCLHP